MPTPDPMPLTSRAYNERCRRKRLRQALNGFRFTEDTEMVLADDVQAVVPRGVTQKEEVEYGPTHVGPGGLPCFSTETIYRLKR